MKIALAFLLLSVSVSNFLIVSPASAVETKATDSGAAELKVLYKFVDLLKAGKNAEAAEMVRYPLRRSEPLKPIANAKEFVQSVDQFFDKNVLKEIENKKKDTMTSWRGTFIAAGSLYADAGKITAINVSTPEMKRAIDQARKAAKSGTHSSVADYVGLKFECVTDRHHVQIQDLGGDKIRYVSWAPGNLSKKPELVLPDGSAEWQGTGGGVIYRFNGGDFTYEVEKVGVCGEDCNSYLRVLRGKQILTKQVCVEAK